MRRLPTLLVALGLAAGSAGLAACGEDDVSDAARDAGKSAEEAGEDIGRSAEDAYEQGKDEAGEVKDDVENELSD